MHHGGINEIGLKEVEEELDELAREESEEDSLEDDCDEPLSDEQAVQVHES